MDEMIEAGAEYKGKLNQVILPKSPLLTIPT